ncbi:hypothetical protein CW304_15490 [Bacillus sp. UFRGS-B20]|nr:hypothetical protein CW304_15490 [Bacillus sp. UFRGS-B20]
MKASLSCDLTLHQLFQRRLLSKRKKYTVSSKNLSQVNILFSFTSNMLGRDMGFSSKQHIIRIVETDDLK